LINPLHLKWDVHLIWYTVEYKHRNCAWVSISLSWTSACIEGTAKFIFDVVGVQFPLLVDPKKFSSLVLEFETIDNPNKHTQIDEKDKSTTWPRFLLLYLKNRIHVKTPPLPKRPICTVTYTYTCTIYKFTGQILNYKTSHMIHAYVSSLE
jgi:hypothetical protein